MPEEIVPVSQNWNSRSVQDQEWWLRTLKVAVEIVAPLMVLSNFIRQKERAVPLVSFSWPTRASEVPERSPSNWRLVGRVPSELEDEFIQYLEARDRMVTYDQCWDFCNVLGVVVRAQRVDDVVLSRPVFVSREWTGRSGDISEGPVPDTEWQRH